MPRWAKRSSVWRKLRQKRVEPERVATLPAERQPDNTVYRARHIKQPSAILIP
jgi:hypothetical protein